MTRKQELAVLIAEIEGDIVLHAERLKVGVYLVVAERVLPFLRDYEAALEAMELAEPIRYKRNPDDSELGAAYTEGYVWGWNEALAALRKATGKEVE